MAYFSKRKLGKIALSTALTAIFALSLTTPAFADRDDHDWRWHEREARHWHRVHPHPVPVVTPVYAPPPVVYAPPPPPSGINLILPLNFR